MTTKQIQTVLKKENISTKVSKKTLQDVFRLLFSGSDFISELFPGSVVIGINDITELNSKIQDKLKHYEVSGFGVNIVANYENNKSEEYSNWQRFIDEDWTTSDVLESLNLNWKFFIKLPDAVKPSIHTINVRISSSIKPQFLIQAIFSKDPEEIENVELSMVPIICRIDFIDHILSHEFLEIISKWKKSLRSPEYVFPFMKKVQRLSNTIRRLVRYTIPFISAISCFGYYFKYSQSLDLNSVATTGIFIKTIFWYAISSGIIFFSIIIGKGVSLFIEKQLDRYGNFSVLEITKGDKKKQTKLLAKTQNSFSKFILSILFALLWNIIGGIITAILMCK